MTTRGSDRLQQHWPKEGFVISDKLRASLESATEELALSDVYIKGIPRPEVLRASFEVEGDERCGNGVLSLLKALQGLGVGPNGKVVVFPKGIPANLFVVSLELGA